MEFELSDEQVMLRDTVREVLTRKYDIETLRAVTGTELGWDRGVWNSLAEIGILGLLFAEDDGGVGAGPEELAAVLEEFGASLAPEPFLDAVVIPGVLLQRGEPRPEIRSRILAGLASGERLLAFAHHEPGDRWPLAAVATTAAGNAVTGVKSLVPHGDCADTFIVSARDEEGRIGLYLVRADDPGVTVTPYRTFDRRRGAQVEFAGADGLRLSGHDAAQTIADAEVLAQTALCAEAVGAMRSALALTTEYLKTRKQFGVPLKTFQALSFRAADMFVRHQLATSMSLYATAALAEGRFDQLVASRARVVVGRSARLVGQESIQLHGGIGVTAEYPVAHYVARLTAIAHTLGDIDAHVTNLAAHVGDYDKIDVSDEFSV